eukprot:TRINITY_DN27002_c0_g1_i1.p1 TRINITY_DN27002_c0_g1~~TRINITY_DN27002_c0_g1_i1.p1  ORF type:complete len:160 (+),score=11.27 TRINITY_DN27002_c0_g1_i1:95-574(+)
MAMCVTLKFTHIASKRLQWLGVILMSQTSSWPPLIDDTLHYRETHIKSALNTLRNLTIFPPPGEETAFRFVSREVNCRRSCRMYSSSRSPLGADVNTFCGCFHPTGTSLEGAEQALGVSELVDEVEAAVADGGVGLPLVRTRLHQQSSQVSFLDVLRPP